MDKALLVDKGIPEGKRLIEALDSKGLPVHAALWLYDSGNEEWRLLIASPMTKEKGPIKTLRFIQSVLNKLKPPPEISLKDVSAISPDNDIIQFIKVAIRTGPGIHAIRFSRNVINGLLIDDAYIYRIL